jgi:ParB family chromosome partitioning protein
MGSVSVVDIDIELIDAPAERQRDFIEPEAVRELAESIRSMGQLEPGLVRPVNGRYEIVFGHRRYLACRLVGVPKFRAIVEDLTDEEVYERRAVENLQRVDLSVIEKAKVFRGWIDKFSLSLNRVAERAGVSVATVSKYLRVLEVPEKYWDALAKKIVSMDAVLALMEVEDEVTRDFYLDAAVQNGITASVARQWVDDYKKSQSGSFYSSGGGSLGDGVGSGVSPVYVACFCCEGPVEAGKVQYVPVCRSCGLRIKGALVGDGN